MAHMGSFQMNPTFTVDAHQSMVNVFRPHAQPLGYPMPMHRGIGYHNVNRAMLAHEQRVMTKEAKPRLHKSEVELLENEFRLNPKPLSQRKRELARQIGLPVPRINNWFQNRRAKAKQDKIQEEYNQRLASKRDNENGESEAEADSTSPETKETTGRAAEATGTSSSSSSSSSNMEQSHGTSTTAVKEEPSSSTPPAPETSSQLVSRFDGGLPSALDTSDATLKSGGPASTSDELTSDFSSPGSLALQSDASPAFNMPFTTQQFLGETSQDDFSMMLPDGPTAFVHDSDMDVTKTMAAMSGSISSTAGPTEVDAFGLPMAVTNTMPDKFPSELLGSHVEQKLNVLDVAQPNTTSCQDDQLSPLAMVQSPPSISGPAGFKSPQPVDIASRRGRRPAPISLRSDSSALGPMTSLDMPGRMDSTGSSSPMRRVASATGFPPYRIQKPSAMGLGGLGPRSPMFSDRSKDAMLSTIQQQRSPSVGCLPISASIAPPTPNTPFLNPQIQPQQMRESTVSSTSSDHDRPAFLTAAAAFQSLGDHGVKTPPGTPGFLSQNYQDMMFAAAAATVTTTAPTPAELAFAFNPRDEPILTPSLASFPSEPDFSMATAAWAGQPVTPSFPPQMHQFPQQHPVALSHMGPAPGPGYYHPMTAVGCAPAEYHWGSDPTAAPSYPQMMASTSARSSPGQPKARQFQFTANVTPENYSKPAEK